MDTQQRLAKIESTQKAILDRLDEVSLLLTTAINKEQESSELRFRRNEQINYKFAGGFISYPTANR